MRHLKRIVVGALGVVMAGGAVATALTVPARATPEPPAVVLRTASASALAATGIRLTAPTGSPAVDSAAASKAAIAQYPGSTVREVVLARVDDANSALPVHCLCWVVSLNPPDGFHFPSGGPPNHPNAAQKPTYWIMIIDATTGQFLEGTAS
jgi:hypothetical protein